MNTLLVFRTSRPLLLLFITFFSYSSLSAQGFEGYYQNPTIHNTTTVFATEGGLWTVALQGGLAKKMKLWQTQACQI
jgi:tricorn protease